MARQPGEVLRERRCAPCMKELRPAFERGFALGVWRQVVGDVLARSESADGVTASYVLLTLRAELERRTGLNLAEVEL